MSMSDRIAVLNKGRFEQIGTPDEVYHRPASAFVARFIGQPPMNIIDAELTGEIENAALSGPGFSIADRRYRGAEERARLPRRLAFGLRPETLRVAPGEGPDTPFAGEVVWIERLGSKSHSWTCASARTSSRLWCRRIMRFDAKGPPGWVLPRGRTPDRPERPSCSFASKTGADGPYDQGRDGLQSNRGQRAGGLYDQGR